MTIELEGMKFRAYHGCLESERKEGNDFEVDFRAQLPAAVRAAKSDSLDDTLDYGAVYDIIAREMAIPSNLLENVAGRIVEAIAKEFPQVGDFSVRVSKACPPVNGECRWSRVTLTRQEYGK